MRNIILTFAACLIVSGCGITDIASKAHVAASEKGAEASDAFLEGNMQELCYWTTVGALERRFGDNPTAYKQYHELCGHKIRLAN